MKPISLYIRIIVFFSFLMNSFFCYSYTNLIIGGVPLNEILLLVGLIICIPQMPNILERFSEIKSILLWSIIFMPFVIWGFSKYGKWAFRDASHIIEVWWIPCSIVAFHRIKEKDLRKYLNIFVILALIKSIISFLKLDGFLIINGLHGELDFLTSNSTGMVFITTIAFWGYIIGIHKNFLIIPLFTLGLVLGQSRSGFFSFLLMSLVYIFIMKIKVTAILKICSIILSIAVVYIILINFNQLSEHTKFKKLLTVQEYYQLMESTSGKSNNFEGSADGVIRRNNWRSDIFKKASESARVMFLGQGFGIPLTDFSLDEGVEVREPHNSYLSVFARTGIIGFIVWISFHLVINFKTVQILFRNNRIIKSFNLKLLLILYLSLINMYTIALSQPGFENPYWAIPSFIVIGAIVYLYRREINVIKYVKSKNFNCNTILQSGPIYRGSNSIGSSTKL